MKKSQVFAKKDEPYVSTTNACKLCTPLGACVAFKGIEGAVPYLHGSQGCATYMRRYIISHFREPVDIASSALGEKQAIYGGGPNLKLGLINVIKKYGAKVVGIATTCLTETIGDDVTRFVHEFKKEFGPEMPEGMMPEIVFVRTPSYTGTHMDGFHEAVTGTVDQLAEAHSPTGNIALFPGFVSAEDIRHLKYLFREFGLGLTLLPDYSDTLDGPALEDYENISSGGTTVEEIKALGGAKASVEFGRTLFCKDTPATTLEKKFSVPARRLGMPIGLRETDAFMDALEDLAGKPMPRELALERGRLVDAYVDGHKYIFGKKALVYGEEDLVVALTAFLAEIGVKPVMVASGGKSGRLAEAIREVTDGLLDDCQPVIRDNVDFFDIVSEAAPLKPDLVIGHSKGYRVAAKEWNVPLIRVGFPIHDRFGGQRQLHLGYQGTQRLLDQIVNAVIEKKQEDSDIGYGYI